LRPSFLQRRAKVAATKNSVYVVDPHPGSVSLSRSTCSVLGVAPDPLFLLRRIAVSTRPARLIVAGRAPVASVSRGVYTGSTWSLAAGATAV